ncbi:peptidoglycan/xylan/chitin deacetylase (PgdA/CDA1 family) [Streptomyces olivoverticillatus]|uniref:Peptidoglycan/xylan/chitin deacetylase (PgdA/CDA1 family) n=1 Tax=Streptomyces olivoverticillatus TaxID=66427 RepID=A0A7W7LK33_9ACTN|nr:polysaccharide deacetylase family protein [Streptomyces olivoverticillatus]MBB4891307.1 peptidoglycan/xylan/chitin deacetylase (PgdA/CDA1 family) [Streptomyces olivoverticillatus]
MARLTARKRKLTIAAASVLALAGVISGTVAMATQDSGGAPGHARGPSPDGRAGTPGIPSASVSRGPVSPEISHDAEDPGKVVNLTIDDGPDPVWTPKVLDVLKKYGAKATFCMIGPQAKARPDLVKKVLAAGHRLCDHSVDHNTAMDKRSEDYQRQQILDAQKMIEDAAGPGVPVLYYRAPGGAFTPYSRKLAADHGMRPLGWNVDTHDWQRPGTERIVETVEKELREGPTILFHDGGGDRSQTVAALEETLPWLKNQGYGFSFPKS